MKNRQPQVADQAKTAASATTVELKTFRTICGFKPTTNIKSVTGTSTNFSPALRSTIAFVAGFGGPLKSDFIARINVTAVKSRPSTATAVNEAATANEALKMRNS